MGNLPLADPTLAKQVWDSMHNASTRRVARKLRQAGASIRHMTVARWRNQGWRPLDGGQQHPLEVALASLDDAVPVLSADPLTRHMSQTNLGDDHDRLRPMQTRSRSGGVSGLHVSQLAFPHDPLVRFVRALYSMSLTRR